MRLEPGAPQGLDLDRVDQRGGPRATWPLWARWNDELGQRYTLGVEEELMLLEPCAGSLAQSSERCSCGCLRSSPRTRSPRLTRR